MTRVSPPTAGVAQFARYPFTLGVASGSPLPTGVVLWTRLAPAAQMAAAWAAPSRWLGGRRGRAVRAHRAARAARRGPGARAQRARRGAGLEPERWYFYRFIGRRRGQPGRPHAHRPGARRPPAAAALRLGLVPALRATASTPRTGTCAAEELDLMVFLGDYIYEGPGRPGASAATRRRGADARAVPQPPRAVQDRPGSAAPARRGPVARDVGRSRGRQRLRRTRSRSRSTPHFLRRRAAAYQAYFEHMPLREHARPTARMVLRSRHRLGRARALPRPRRPPAPHAAGLPAAGRGGSNRSTSAAASCVAPGRTMLGAPRSAGSPAGSPPRRSAGT